MKVDNSNSIGVSKSCSIPIPVKAIDWYDFEMAADPDLGWKNKKEEIEGLRPMASTFLCTLSEAGNKVGVSPLPRALIYPLSYLFLDTLVKLSANYFLVN